MENEEAKSPERKAGMTFGDVMARARGARASADPHIRAIAMKAKRAADAAQLKAVEYQPEAAKLIRTSAARVRGVVEAAKPRLEHLVEEARPRMQKAARDAADYVNEHQDELRQAALEATRVMTPRALRPMVDNMTALKDQPQPKGPPQSDSTEA